MFSRVCVVRLFSQLLHGKYANAIVTAPTYDDASTILVYALWLHAADANATDASYATTMFSSRMHGGSDAYDATNASTTSMLTPGMHAADANADATAHATTLFTSRMYGWPNDNDATDAYDGSISMPSTSMCTTATNGTSNAI